MPPSIKTNKKYKIAGELRRSQTISTYGSGAIVDLPRLSGIIAGIDQWGISIDDDFKIHERNLEIMLGKDFFYQIASSDTDNSDQAIRAFRFPSWYYCPECHRLDYYSKIAKSTSNNKTDYNSALFCNKCSSSKRNTKLIPSRFIMGCLNGHVEDFPYIWWAHRKKGMCDTPQLLLEYEGSTGGLDSIHITCENCGAHTTMAGAMSKDALKGLKCSGNMPWLGYCDNNKGWYKDPETCGASLNVLQRNANNVHYPVNQSALTIPPWSNKIQVALAYRDDLFEEFFEEFTDEERLKKALIKQYNKSPDLYGNDEEVFLREAFKRYCDHNTEVNERTLRIDEYIAFCGGDINEEYFITTSAEVPAMFEKYISKIKLVKKLREVRVLQGFRRILPSSIADKQEREKLGLSNNDFSPISRQPLNWLPAVELFGEGIFIQLKEESVLEWEKNNKDRYLDMWKRLDQRWIGNNMFDSNSPRYVLLHTLSHLIINQLTSQCGYATASLKEKIYSTYTDHNDPMCGILIYTSATDTDGSLGGLVREGYSDRIDNTLRRLLDESSWCSNDPICIDSKNQGFKGLNYAACHACSLLPETSCEAFNCLLDRASITGTPDNPEISFFKNIIGCDV